MTDADLKPYVPNDEFNRQLSDLKDQAENVCQCCGHRADLAPVVKPLIWREDAGDELAHNGLGWLYRITWANDPEVGFLLYRHESSGKTRLGAHSDPEELKKLADADNSEAILSALGQLGRGNPGASQVPTVDVGEQVIVRDAPGGRLAQMGF